MPTSGPLAATGIKATVKSEAAVFPVGDMTAGRIQLVYNGARNEAVWTVLASIDRQNWVGLDTTLTMSTAGISRLIDLTGYVFLRVELTTAESTNTDLRADITLFAQSD